MIPASAPGRGGQGTQTIAARSPDRGLAVSAPSRMPWLSTGSGWPIMLGLSVAIGFLASRSVAFATVHLLVTCGAVVAVSLVARRPRPIVMITAYAGLCDVLWRSASARGPYEGSKYALVFGFACIVVRFVPRPRNLGLVMGIIVLLVPGALLGIDRLGPAIARQYVVANLAGLVALSLGVLACSNLLVSHAERYSIYLVALGPPISVATIAAMSTFTGKDLNFGDVSNVATAGGFGPVQVSSLLCFGGLLCVLILIDKGFPSSHRLVALATGAVLVGQAVLTFSRGGIFSFVLAVSVAGLVSLSLTGQRIRTVVLVGLLVVVGLQILSWAGAFTGGASEERFSSTDTSNRTEIASGDLKLFEEEPLFGVGVGLAKYERDFAVEAAPHTEYSRLLAEHGVFGLVAIILLAILCLRIFRASEGQYRVATAALLVMSLSQMMHSATRIGCIPLGFALAALREDSGN